ncbi:ArsR/SmtB family transcription factor [Psychromicrobium xiongbiense]|uniref:ArsR/SmtB family transcription factor n=1 Tax=Psychromicrobium xiongbiense TaxID=3051184 RepID=UPI00255246B0|nr:metalloregulator ArsR/SmtB family transcription factor [Psychromicrobium sp. YIM S02556]
MSNDVVFSVLAEQTRRDLLLALRSGDRAVGELVTELALSQPTVSKHLRVLREAGLVSMRAEGQRRYYALSPEPLADAQEWLGQFTAPQTRLVPAGAASAGTSPAASPAGSHGAVPHGVTTIRPAASTGRPEGGDNPEEWDEAGTVPQQIGRSVGRAATRAADLLANLPKFGRRKD